MNTLKLTLKKKWFDMIASGEKKEEYREIKPYWHDRLIKEVISEYTLNPTALTKQTVIFKEFDFVEFTNGYGSDRPKLTLECKGICMGNAKPEWSDNWQGDVFVISLGKIIATNKE